MVRKPASIVDSKSTEPINDLAGIPHSVDARGESESHCGLDQELVELAVTLIVAPIADPDEILFLAAAGQRMEQRRIRRFVPGVGPSAPAPCRIDVAEHLSEGEHAIVAREVEEGDLVRGGDGAMMRVMEEKREAAARFALRSDAGDEL